MSQSGTFEILDQPYTAKPENSEVNVNVTIDVDDLMNRTYQEGIDFIGEAVVSSDTTLILEDFSYCAVGVTEDGLIIFNVEGSIRDISEM